MALSLHADCRKRLTDCLDAAIAALRVTKGMFIDSESVRSMATIDEVLPSGRQKEASQWIGELPFFTFAYDSLSRAVYEQGRYEENAAGAPLTSLRGYENTRVVAEDPSLPMIVRQLGGHNLL
jgi:hypothetical protein